MQVRALKTFQSRYGLIRRGQVFNAAPGYVRDLAKNKLVEVIAEQPGPGEEREDKSIPGAPRKKDDEGKGEAGGSGPATGSPTEAPSPDAGATPPSASSQAAPASPGKTLTSSTVGARRGTPTQRKKRVQVGKPKAGE